VVHVRAEPIGHSAEAGEPLNERAVDLGGPWERRAARHEELEDALLEDAAGLCVLATDRSRQLAAARIWFLPRGERAMVPADRAKDWEGARSKEPVEKG
jgi:hypothetical protein